MLKIGLRSAILGSVQIFQGRTSVGSRISAPSTAASGGADVETPPVPSEAASAAPPGAPSRPCARVLGPVAKLPPVSQVRRQPPHAVGMVGGGLRVLSAPAGAAKIPAVPPRRTAQVQEAYVGPAVKGRPCLLGRRVPLTPLTARKAMAKVEAARGARPIARVTPPGASRHETVETAR